MQTLKEYTVKSESFFNLISDPILWRQCQKFEAFQTFFCVCAYTHIHSHTHRHTYVHIYIYASFSVVYLFLQKCYCTRHTVLQFAFFCCCSWGLEELNTCPGELTVGVTCHEEMEVFQSHLCTRRREHGLRDHAGWVGLYRCEWYYRWEPAEQILPQKWQVSWTGPKGLCQGSGKVGWAERRDEAIKGLECQGEARTSYSPGQKMEVVLLEERRSVSVVHACACVFVCLCMNLLWRWQGTVWVVLAGRSW